MDKDLFRESECYSCQTPIMVARYDLAPRTYCQTCAWNKLGAVPPAIAGREE
jgi:hypothetical protein